MFTSSNLLVLMKLQPTVDVDASPAVGTDDVPVLLSSSGVKWGAASTGPMNLGSPYGGQRRGVLATRKPTFSYDIPIYGKGLAGSPSVIVYPNWLEILRTVFSTSVGSADKTQVLMTPDPFYPTNTDDADTVTANTRLFTLYEYKGLDGAYVGGSKTLSKLINCRITRVSVKYTVGAVTMLTIEGVGQYTADPATVTTDLSGADLDGFDGGDAIVMNALQTTITPAGGSAIACAASALDLTWDFGSEHIEGDDAESGVTATSVRDVTVTGSINPIVEPGDVANWQALVQDKTPFAIATAANGAYPISRSADTGYGLKIAVAQAQADDANEFAKDSPVLRLPISFTVSRATVSGAAGTMQIL
jgi:hypothetical protein